MAPLLPRNGIEEIKESLNGTVAVLQDLRKRLEVGSIGREEVELNLDWILSRISGEVTEIMREAGIGTRQP